MLVHYRNNNTVITLINSLFMVIILINPLLYNLLNFITYPEFEVNLKTFIALCLDVWNLISLSFRHANYIKYASLYRNDIN